MVKFQNHKMGSEENLNKDICDMLMELADYEKNITKNTYKYNAYRQAALVLKNHPARITSGDEAKKLKGIGQRIADKINTFLKTGKLPKLEQIKKDKKFEVIKLLTRVSGIGPKKAEELADKGVKTIEDLKKYYTELTHHQKIGLKYFYDFERRIPREEVFEIEKIITKGIADINHKFLVTICGSYRRGQPSSGDVDCLVTHPNYTSKAVGPKATKYDLEGIVTALTASGFIIDTIALGRTKFMGVCRVEDYKPARRLDIRLTYMDQYFCSVLYFTGSDLFNKNMRLHALDQGYTLNEYALRPIGVTGVPGEPVPITCEKDIFDYINYPYKKPEERNI